MRKSLATAVLLLAATAARGATGELNLFAWSEYVPQAVIDGFTRETGIQVNYESYSSNEEMLAKLVSGAQRYDLIQPSEYVVEALVNEKLLLPLSDDKLPNLRNLAPEYREITYRGARYSVAWMAGTVGIVVDGNKVQDEIRSYRDVFQEKFRGRIVIVDDPREIVSWALASLDLDVNDVSDGNLARARTVLERWLPLVKVYDSDSPKTALLNGDVDIGIVWSGEAALLYRQDKKFRYVLPQPGAHRFLDNLAIPANATNPQAAHRFIDYILRPQVSRLISAEFPYTNPNLETRRLLTAEELDNPASYPKATVSLTTLRDIGAAAVKIDKLITDLKAAN
ncbi:MAG TPA: spermidine/putrescine ABC transporter substrate-binding protein [Terriglobales bacterium]|nr:spermidine/putrescine ABC transporter substrate-binding protein [Terriglobales bacterium]